jgi:glutamate-5-semialdehyde dehydrogenase
MAEAVNDLKAELVAMGQAARAASRSIAAAATDTKSQALRHIAARVDQNRDGIKAANARDMAGAEANGIDQPLIDRLLLDDKGIDRMIEGIHQVDGLRDPVGEITDLSYQPTGIQVGKMRVPLGVIAMIYESRPNVTVDAAALSIKSGNACILRGGSEAFESNQAIGRCVTEGLIDARLPQAAVQLFKTTDRAAVGELLKLSEYVDVIVPRGGKGLIERIMRDSMIPIIKHLDGVCHVYIDQAADIPMAQDLACNSKAEKYAVCNALETLLVHKEIAAEILPDLARRFDAQGVALRGCDRACQFVEDMSEATEADWYEEYLGPTLAVRVVDDLEQAIGHINQYGSQHTDCIVTENYSRARQFVAEVDSSSVLVNTSTQFADGFEYGLGAEVGISTDKIHARGPVGLEGLTSQKYVVYGTGQIRHR